MRVVPVDRARFSAWKDLRRALYTSLDETFHEREMEALFSCPDAACFLVESEAGEAAGLLELSLRNFVDGCLVGGPVGYVEGVYLKPEHRGQGQGRRLLDFAAAWFREKGCREMATDAELANADAQAFYRAAGFTERWTTVGFTKPLP